MQYKSPYLRLDELRQARDKEMFDASKESARAIGQASLNAGNVIKSFDDRQRAIEEQRRKAQLESDQWDRNKEHLGVKEQQMLLQAEAAKDRAAASGVQADAATERAKHAGTRAGVTVSREERMKQTQEAKDRLARLKRVAFPTGVMDIDLDAEDANSKLIDRAYEIYENTEGVKDNFTFEEVKAGILEAALENQKLKNQKTKLSIDQQKADAIVERSKAATQRMLQRQSKLPTRGRLVGDGTLKDLAGLTSQVQKVDEVIQAVSKLEDSVTPGFMKVLEAKAKEYFTISDEPAQLAARQEIASYFNKQLKLQSGTAVTENELERMMKEVSTFGYSKETIINSFLRQKEDLMNEHNNLIDYQVWGGRTSAEAIPKFDQKTGKRATPVKTEDPEEPKAPTKAPSMSDDLAVMQSILGVSETKTKKSKTATKKTQEPDRIDQALDLLSGF